MTNTDDRALDRAVAEAMGWTDIAPNGVGTDLGGRYRDVPRYSTDPATLPEMLGFFKAQEPRLFITLEQGTRFWQAWAHASRDDAEAPARASADGATITEAVARLVAAVHRAKKEQKQ